MTQREASLITEMERALGHAIGAPVRVTTEDRLRGAIIEACSWLRLSAPGRALEVLEASLQHEIAVIKQTLAKTTISQTEAEPGMNL